jgi:nucleoside-diphosphate-sugar epimerase
MKIATIAVTGASGVLGQRLLPLLDGRDDVVRIVALDVRDPTRRVGKLAFQRADLASTDLPPLLEDVDALVHLAARRDPHPDERLMERVNVEGTRRLLDAASAVGVRKIVWVSSAAVYGAWPDNPVPLGEDALLRPNPGYLPPLHDAESERLLAEWSEQNADAGVVVLRLAPVVGPGSMSLLARAALGHAPATVRDAARPVQVVHVDDAAAAVSLAVAGPLDGVYNVAADSWLDATEADALVGHRRLPGLPYELAHRTLGAMWKTGLGDAPPSVLPYLVHPWVVANDRLKAAGWTPRHTNEEAILLSSEQPGSSQVGWMVAAGAIVVGAAGATWAMRRRRHAR